MFTKKGFVSLLLSLCLLFIFASFASSYYLEPEIAEYYTPRALRVGIITSEDITAGIARYQGFLQYLSEETGMDIEWYLTTSYASLSEAQAEGYVDIGFHGPFSFAIAYARSGGLIEPLANSVYTLTGENYYHAYIVVKEDSEYESFDDLEGKVLGIADPGSASGNLIPRSALEPIYGTFEDYFSNVIYTGGHDSTVRGVVEGQLDAGTMAQTTLSRIVDRGIVSYDDIRFIWTSDPIPPPLHTIRADLNPEIRAKLEAAYVVAHEDIRGQQYLADTNATRLLLSKTLDYKPIFDAWAFEEGKTLEEIFAEYRF